MNILLIYLVFILMEIATWVIHKYMIENIHSINHANSTNLNPYNYKNRS